MNVTYLSNIISAKSSFKSPFELFYGKKPTLHDNLKMFGEVGVVRTKDKIQAKLRNQRNSLYVCWIHGESLKRCL
jgi:hypothetical protein